MKTKTSCPTPLHDRHDRNGSPRRSIAAARVFRAARAGAPFLPGALRAVLVSVALVAASARAVVYDFLPVSILSTNSAKFTSLNGNGFITATTGVNIATNALAPENNTVDNSTFTNLFLASGTVQGWVTRYENNSIYTNTFYLTNYTITPSTVFAIWNMTEETNTYTIQAFAGNTLISPPFTWSLLGYDDNALLGNIGWVHLVLNPATGIISTNIFKPSGGTDSDAAFWTNIPPNTTKIVIRGALAPNGRDGVMFYFAEPRPCVLTCPSNIVVTICGNSTVVNYTLPTLSGDCGTNMTAICDPGSGSLFYLGTNVVHCNVPGFTNSCTFTVTVLNSDTNPPVINCPSNIVIFTCGTNAVATYNVTATDDQGTPILKCSVLSGATFPLGTNSVACTATDACSNITTCAFDVIVKQYPLNWSVICPNESASINVTGCPPVMPSVTNLVIISNQCPISGGLSVTQSPPAGTVLSAGTQNVVIWVCATNGNCSNCTVVVNSTISSGCCAIDCSTNRTVTTCGNNAVVTYPLPAISGPCASNASVVCTPVSGSTFPLGTNTVTCTATNGAGVTVASCSFNVTVVKSAYTNAYDFLPVTITGPGAKFTSPNGKGIITVTNTGGPFLGLNNTMYPSQFPNLFAASGPVQGWLAQADNNAVYTNTFYLGTYMLSNSTVFGIWNTTEETNTYSIKLLDAANNPISPPFNWNFLGYDDDALSGNISWYHMNLNYATGVLSPTNYAFSGIDCDAAFWDNIPLNTRKIVVTGTLGALNADGVVFYFAERRPCPGIPCPFCPVDIGVSLAGSSIVLSWSQNATNFFLEETPDLTGLLANWTAVTNVPITTNSEYRVTLPAQQPRKYYRLKQTFSP